MQLESLSHAAKLRDQVEALKRQVVEAEAGKVRARTALGDTLADPESTDKDVVKARRALPEALARSACVAGELAATEAALTQHLAAVKGSAQTEFAVKAEEIHQGIAEALTRAEAGTLSLQGVLDLQGENQAHWAALEALRREWKRWYPDQPQGVGLFRDVREAAAPLAGLAQAVAEYHRERKRLEITREQRATTPSGPPPQPRPPAPRSEVKVF